MRALVVQSDASVWKSAWKSQAREERRVKRVRAEASVLVSAAPGEVSCWCVGVREVWCEAWGARAGIMIALIDWTRRAPDSSERHRDPAQTEGRRGLRDSNFPPQKAALMSHAA
jgi:hypothetical protein